MPNISNIEKKSNCSNGEGFNIFWQDYLNKFVEKFEKKFSDANKLCGQINRAFWVQKNYVVSAADKLDTFNTQENINFKDDLQTLLTLFKNIPLRSDLSNNYAPFPPSLLIAPWAYAFKKYEQALDILNRYIEKNSHLSIAELTDLARLLQKLFSHFTEYARRAELHIDDRETNFGYSALEKLFATKSLILFCFNLMTQIQNKKSSSEHLQLQCVFLTKDVMEAGLQSRNFLGIGQKHLGDLFKEMLAIAAEKNITILPTYENARPTHQEEPKKEKQQSTETQNNSQPKNKTTSSNLSISDAHRKPPNEEKQQSTETQNNGQPKNKTTSNNLRIFDAHRKPPNQEKSFLHHEMQAYKK